MMKNLLCMEEKEEKPNEETRKHSEKRSEETRKPNEKHGEETKKLNNNEEKNKSIIQPT